MGLVFEGVGQTDRQFVSVLVPELVRTLRKASTEVRANRADTKIALWFGDTSPNWKMRLGAALSQMASVINLETITISFAPLRERTGVFSNAIEPNGDFGTYNTVQDARGRGFAIELDTAWNTTPKYGSLANHDSMFQTLAHEFSHLCIHTEDHQYGFAGCQALARRSPYKAKDNADTWGFFIESFRV